MDDITGQIFHVIRGSFVDGYGVRTTVFLKGCPLQCVWCCNPEGQLRHPEIKFTVSECNGCGNCAHICPANAIQLQHESEENKIKINRELCTNCGKCIDVCYTGALEFFGKYYTVDELFTLIERDEEYYRPTGGGVTFGGGEPTLQPHFTHALLQKCRENYIHTALDTCGYTPTHESQKVLEEADLILFDIKGIDPQEHLRNTGVSNEPILKNLKRLDSLGKPVIIRMPIIPGYNDSKQNIQHAAEFLSNLKTVERVDLIAYHEYSRIKYQQLDREYKLHIQQPLTEERLNDIKETLKRHGLKVQLGG